MGAGGDHTYKVNPDHLAGWCLCALLALVAHAAWADEPNERVRVADPYLELHTGPGRGYPIFDIAARGESVEILRRHTDWFKVRTERRKEGWVSRDQMEATLTEAGEKKTFRDVLFEDYLARRMEFGFSFGELRHDPLLSLPARLHGISWAIDVRNRPVFRLPCTTLTGVAAFPGPAGRPSFPSERAGSRTPPRRRSSARPRPKAASPTPPSACAITSPGSSSCASRPSGTWP
jgi:hypothetical protein